MSGLAINARVALQAGRGGESHRGARQGVLLFREGGCAVKAPLRRGGRRHRPRRIQCPLRPVAANHLPTQKMTSRHPQLS